MHTATHIAVFVTVPDEKTARQIAGAVLTPHLAACVNIIPAVRSLYWWKGEIQDDAEMLLIMKTRAEKFHGLEAAVRSAHPYDVPEIIALPITAGHAPYLKWIDDNAG